MAEENEEKKEEVTEAKKNTKEAAPAATKKKFPLKMVIIIAVAVIVIAGGAIGAITFFKGDKEAVQAEEATAEETLETESIGVPMDTFILNLADKDKNKYLKITLELRITSEEMKTQIEENMSKIKDIVVVYLSAKTFDEVKTVEGKLQLKAEIMKRINSVLKEGNVKEIYFTEFVVQ